MFILLAILLLVPMIAFICGIAIGRSGREALRVEIQRLRELYFATKAVNDTLAQNDAAMKRITESALELAKQRHFPNPQGRGEIFINDNPVGQAEVKFNFADVAPNYVGPEEKHCPECSVSVRSENWPQECPACHCLFGFNEA